MILISKRIKNNLIYRKYTRFIKTKEAGTGLDQSASLKEFYSHEIIKPYKNQREALYEMYYPQRRLWALRTTKNPSDIEQLPKIQQYKDCYFHDRTKEDIEKYNSSFLPTDHIAFRIPSFVKNKKEGETKLPDSNYSYLEMKSKFNSCTETKNHWVAQRQFLNPYNNKSSVAYDIINHEAKEMPDSGYQRLNMYDKKKGIGEFADLTRPNKDAFNKDYQMAYNENPNIFKRYKGLLSHIADFQFRNQNMSKNGSGEVRRMIKSQSTPNFMNSSTSQNF